MRFANTANTATVLTLSLGSAIAIGDPALLSSNIAIIRSDMQLSLSAASLVTSGAFLTLAGTILGAGALGDNYGRRKMFLVGACGAFMFGLVGAAAPNVAVLTAARVGAGVSFAFLLSLSLAIVNAAFPPDRIAGAIALYIGAGSALAIVPPIVGSELIDHFGWRSGFLVTPVLALVLIASTVKFVPETPRAHRALDLAGMLLLAVALITLLYGVSHLNEGIHAAALVPIMIGILSAAAFWWWESHTAEPALEPRIFRSPGFAAAIFAGAVYAFVMGGSAAVLTGYIVIIRGAPATLLHLLYIPGTILAALTAVGAGRATARLGGSTVMVGGLVLLAVAMSARLVADGNTPISVLAVLMAAGAIAGAIVQTTQTTVLMNSAPQSLGGVVSAAKSTVQSVAYAFGSALFTLLGVALFQLLGGKKLAGYGISAEQARDMLRMTHVHGASHGIPNVNANDPQRAEWVVSAASSIWIQVGQILSLSMAAASLAAAGLAFAILRPRRVSPTSRQ